MEIDRKRLVRARCGYRPVPKGLGFGPTASLRTYKGIGLLLIDPAAVEDLTTERRPSTFPHYLRSSGIAIADLGGPCAGPLWWKEPYLVWAISADRSTQERARPPAGWKVLAKNLRSESGVIVLARRYQLDFISKTCRPLYEAERACRIGKVPSGLWTPFVLRHEAAPGAPPAAARDLVFLCKPDAEPKPPGPWNIDIDLTGIRKQDDFFRTLAREFGTDRRRLWDGILDKANDHRGTITIRFAGWQAFERTFPKGAFEWREKVRMLTTAGEISNFKVRYDTAPAGPVVPTRRLQVYLVKGCRLTLPELARRLRDLPLGWTVSGDAKKLEVRREDWSTTIATLKKSEVRPELRDWVHIDQFVENDDEEDISVIAAAPRILEVTTDHPRARTRTLGKLWQAVIDAVRGFPGAHVSDEEFESPE